MGLKKTLSSKALDKRLAELKALKPSEITSKEAAFLLALSVDLLDLAKRYETATTNTSNYGAAAMAGENKTVLQELQSLALLAALDLAKGTLFEVYEKFEEGKYEQWK